MRDALTEDEVFIEDWGELYDDSEEPTREFYKKFDEIYAWARLIRCIYVCTNKLRQTSEVGSPTAYIRWLATTFLAAFFVY